MKQRRGPHSFRDRWLRKGVAWFSLLSIVVEPSAVQPVRGEFPLGIASQQGTRGIDQGIRSFWGRRIAPTMSYQGAPWLIRATRQREEDCELLLAQLQIKPGMTVADLGCGNGYYSLKLAKLVGPTGKVLAVDIQTEMLRLLQARAEEERIENIVPLESSELDPRLPPGEVDLILCVDVYHELSQPETMLTAMRRALSANGVIVLAEFREEDAEVPILPLHKMSKAQILRELVPNGLKVQREFDGLPWQHLMFFARDET